MPDLGRLGQTWQNLPREARTRGGGRTASNAGRPHISYLLHSIAAEVGFVSSNRVKRLATILHLAVLSPPSQWQPSSPLHPKHLPDASTSLTTHTDPHQPTVSLSSAGLFAPRPNESYSRTSSCRSSGTPTSTSRPRTSNSSHSVVNLSGGRLTPSSGYIRLDESRS